MGSDVSDRMAPGKGKGMKAMTRIDRETRHMYLACAQALVRDEMNLDAADDAGMDIELPVFSVGQVADLADIHPQTLRQYDRLGLIVPKRTEGGARRYSLRDLDRLTQAQHLSQDESINLAGVTRILALAEENRQLRRQLRRSRQAEEPSMFAAAADGRVVEIKRSDSARLWRQEIMHEYERYPSGEPVRRGKKPVSTSKSLIIWGMRS